MKKVILIFTIAVGLFGTSCKKYLDINTNPNSATSASPSLILPLAIVNTASLTSNLNNYGSQTVGYVANAGGYGGFGSTWSYNYTPSDGEGYWDLGYEIMENLQSVINSTEGSNDDANYNAAAKIMKAYVAQMLVDEFNDIPYSDALQGGSAVLNPTYDKATDIYPALATLLDSAVIELNTASYPTVLSSGVDPLFNGDMTKWKQFANTLRLRLILRTSEVSGITMNKTFSADGFLTDDAIVNPGYTLASASSGTQVNPSWNYYVTDYTGARGTYSKEWNPAYFVYGYYDGNKLKDPARGAAIYFAFPNDSVNSMGFQPPANTLTSPGTAGAWYSGSGSGTSLGNAIGVMKGPNMGEPLMLLAESDFLQAEADVRSILSQNAATDFNNGIAASFRYLYKDPSNKVASGYNPDTDAADYITANSTSYLANFALATTTAQKIEAIITQKYIALNMVSGQEAWSEYRRTGYPVTSTSKPLNTSTGSSDPYGSFASTQSQATRPDFLPTRLPYPASEASTNSSNVPTGISVYTSQIFWAKP